MKLACLAAALVLVTSCGTPDAVSTAAAIVSGTDDTGASPEFPSVANTNAASTCTGTLITPSHVLLAAHCVAVAPTTRVDFAPRTVDPDRATAFVVDDCWMMNEYTSLNLGLVNSELRVAGESRDALRARLGDRCGVLTGEGLDDFDHGGGPVDIALVRLSRPVPHPVAGSIGVFGGGGYATRPIPILAVGVTPASPFTAVGYGHTCAAATPICGADAGVRRFVEATVDWTTSWVTTLNTPNTNEVLGLGDSAARCSPTSVA